MYFKINARCLGGSTKTVCSGSQAGTKCVYPLDPQHVFSNLPNGILEYVAY